MDMEIRILEKTIEKLLEESRLPAEVKRLVLEEQVRKASQEADAEINRQLQQKEKEGLADAESV